PHGHPVGVPHGSLADSQHQGHPRQLRPRWLGAGLGDLGYEPRAARGLVQAPGPGRMTSPSARLRELGLTLPSVAAPAGSYVPARRSGALVFTAGQLPLVDGTLAA